MIRVISGAYKGRFLKVPDPSVTRPTMDKVRQAIFSAINGKEIGSVCLDLFAGSGAMGIEAISRGATKVYFVDKDRGTFHILLDNIKSLGIDSTHSELFNGDYRVFLKRNRTTKFDLVFLDPPYRMDINASIIRYMIEQNMLSDDALIVSEQEKENEPIEGYVFKEYKYGQKHVAVYRKGE